MRQTHHISAPGVLAEAVHKTGRAKADFESVNYTAAVIEDQAVRVSLDPRKLDNAEDTVVRTAGLIVVTEYKRNPDVRPPYEIFWSDVRNRVKEWGEGHDKVLSIASQLTNKLEAKTLQNPDPSYYLERVTKR